MCINRAWADDAVIVVDVPKDRVTGERVTRSRRNQLENPPLDACQARRIGTGPGCLDRKFHQHADLAGEHAIRCGQPRAGVYSAREPFVRSRGLTGVQYRNCRRVRQHRQCAGNVAGWTVSSGIGDEQDETNGRESTRVRFETPDRQRMRVESNRTQPLRVVGQRRRAIVQFQNHVDRCAVASARHQFTASADSAKSVRDGRAGQRSATRRDGGQLSPAAGWAM